MATRTLGLLAACGALALPATALANPPVITAKLFGTAGQGGWFTSDVTVNWEITPPGYTSSGCDAVTIDTETKGVPDHVSREDRPRGELSRPPS